MILQLGVWFERAPDEPDDHYWDDLGDQIAALSTAGLQREDASLPEGVMPYLSDFPPHVLFEATDKVLAALAGGGLTLLGTWVTAKQGRKIRVKFDDIEIEAASIDEVQSLLKTIKKFKSKR